eukprot:6213654-Pleurochrysis_carterae.AAC.1
MASGYGDSSAQGRCFPVFQVPPRPRVLKNGTSERHRFSFDSATCKKPHAEPFASRIAKLPSLRQNFSSLLALAF